MKKRYGDLEYDDGESEPEAPTAATAEPADDQRLIEMAWQRLPHHMRKHIAPARHARETAAMATTSAPSTPRGGSSMPRPPSIGDTMQDSKRGWDREQWQRFARENPVTHDGLVELCDLYPAERGEIAEAYQYAQGTDHFSQLVVDRSESSKNPASETRTIVPVPTLTDDSVRGLSVAILRGDDELLGAFASALAAGLAKCRNFHIVVAEWVGAAVKEGDGFPSSETAKTIAYLIARGGDPVAPLVGAVRAGLNGGMNARRDTAVTIARALGGPAPTGLSLTQEDRYKTTNPWSESRRPPLTSPGV
jgi:hypothetical protein